MTVRVTAPCRLHFGLIHVPVAGITHGLDGEPIRRFGGLGLMLDEPAVRVTVSPHEQWQTEGPLADRAEGFARRVVGDGVPGLHIRADGPAEHVGLGVGTALGLSVAAACRRLVHADAGGVQELAATVGRGERSGIGMYGFAGGGFIVDAGRIADEPPQLRERIDFPAEWRIVLVRPRKAGRWHGDRERSAFRRPRVAADALASARALERLSADVAAAVRGKQFDVFAAAVSEFNLRAGEPFRGDQGGAYAGPAVSAVVRQLREWGHTGAGQSSWGPTVFCFARCEDEAELLAARARITLPPETDVRVTKANNRGAKLAEDQADEADHDHIGGQNEQ